MIRIAVGGLMMMTMACTTIPAEDEVTEIGSGRTCRAEPIQDMIGRAASQELGADALRRSGAGTLRWINPGDMVTMDYRTDRLNIELDERGRVTRLRCG